MKKTLLNIYSFIILALALTSILLVVFDFVEVINIDKSPWFYFDNGILSRAV